MTTRSGKQRVDPPPRASTGNIKLLQQCHISKDVLEDKQVMVFLQETPHGSVEKMQWVTLTEKFINLHQEISIQRLAYNVGLDPFLSMEICGIDFDRVMEFLSNMQ